MADDSVQRNREITLNCSLCSKCYTSPRMLPCMDRFCATCLQDHVTNCRDNILFCPTCYRDSQMSSSDVESLPRNLFLENKTLLSNLLERDLSGNTSSHCGFCNKVPGCWFCYDCKLFLCAKCKEEHDSNSEIDDHTVMTDENLLRKVSEIIISKAPFCNVHKTKRLRFFCCTCDQLVCWECTLENTHGRHDCVNAKRQHKPSTESLITSVQLGKSQAAKKIDIAKKTAQYQTEINEMITIARKAIDIHFEELMNKLKRDREELMQALEVIERKQTEPLLQSIRQVKHWTDAMQNIQNVTTKVLDGSNHWEILGMKKTVHEGYQKLGEEESRLKSNPRDTRNGMFTEINFRGRPVDLKSSYHKDRLSDKTENGNRDRSYKLTSIEGNILG